MINKEKIKERKKRYYMANRERILKGRTSDHIKQKQYFYNRKMKLKRQTFDYKPLAMFDCIVHRLRSNPYYKNRKLLFNREEFLEWIFKQEAYPRLFKDWVEGNYKKALCPSIDRINNDGDYSLDNIQVITHRENGIKQNK